MNRKNLKQAKKRYQMDVDRLSRKARKTMGDDDGAGLKADDIEGEQPEKEGRDGI